MMTNYYFSTVTLAFYPTELIAAYQDAGTLPSTLSEISDSDFLTYSGVPPEGKTRGSTVEGRPIWVDLPSPSSEELVATAGAKKRELIDQANAYMNSKQWPGKAAMGRMSDSDKAQYNLWLDYLDALEAVDTASAPDINWPEPPAL